MKKLLLIFIISLVSFSLQAQKILLAENQRSFKNFKFYTGDELTFKYAAEEHKVHDIILEMTDSVLVFEEAGEVKLTEIEAFYRGNYVVKILQPLTLLAGAAYFGLDSFNRLINNDAPVILAETVAISAGLVGLSFALTPFQMVRYKTGTKWQLRIIDLNEFGSIKN